MIRRDLFGKLLPLYTKSLPGRNIFISQVPLSQLLSLQYCADHRKPYRLFLMQAIGTVIAPLRQISETKGLGQAVRFMDKAEISLMKPLLLSFREIT